MALIGSKLNVNDNINAIVVTIFKKESERHQHCINAIATAARVGTFMHRGQTFRPSWASSATLRSALPEHVWPDMELFLKDKDIVDKDSQKFWQMLFSMLAPCTSLQDVRNTLPDFLVDLFPELRVYPRTNQEAWTIIDQTRLHRQYLKIREKMELYVMLQKNPQLGQLMSLYHYEA